jgi:hypothetical protein
MADLCGADNESIKGKLKYIFSNTLFLNLEFNWRVVTEWLMKEEDGFSEEKTANT